jgi:hypothetical protein
MGKLSLILVIAAVAVSALVIFRSNSRAADADEQIYEHQYHVLARDAASTGMGTTVRRLTNLLSSNWASNSGGLQQTDVVYNGATYTVQTVSDQCSILPAGDVAAIRTEYGGVGNTELIEVRSTGTVLGNVGTDDRQSHRQISCYLKADWGAVLPPAFQYAMVSNLDMSLSGNAEVGGYLETELGNIHTNSNLSMSGNTDVNGHATYSGNASTSGNASAITITEAEPVPIVQFDAAEFRAANGIPTGATVQNGRFLYTNSNVSLSGNPSGNGTCNNPTTNSSCRIIQDPDNPPDRGASEPYIWYINGNLSLSGQSYVRLPQYTIVIVTGTVSVSGSASIFVSGAPNAIPNQNASNTTVRNWIQTQFINNEMPIAVYSTGDMSLSGLGSILGNYYTNGGAQVSGNGRKVGSVAAYRTISASGNGQFFYTSVAEPTVIPGIRLPGDQIVRIAIAEWTDPVLDAAGI